ncbi:gpi anchored cell wall protein [Diplodia corticola]|uniref:Gpi anchored cell wall protein n=1 Tax=Diplodia corticola TaxID=236234 RepID=A0A1J9S0P5_9PEZI|nr:gpi anchored cell wall protein [Diplodia corticola]OJD33596.1 gpi anchored cell wall protein [Diplodia corticola]
MFSAKFLTFLVVALLGFVNIAAAATPPACLISIIGSEPNPNDVATICKKDSIQSDIASNCGSEKADAMTAYSSVCKAAGVTVSTSASASASASATKSGSSSASATGSVTTPGSSVSTPGASSGSSSGSSSTTTPAPTNDAPNKIQNVGFMALGAFAIGAIALL